MAKRLDIDSNVVAYWGFDEANETDPALDETPSLRHLTVVASTAVVPARANNGRQFNGTSTYAYPADHAPFRISGDLTFIGWAILDQANNAGSFLRTILECAGAGATAAENCLYGFYLSSSGEFVYRHDSASGPVILRTATNLFRVGRYYAISLRRQAGQVWLYIDNQPAAWVSVTVNGVSQEASLTIPVPVDGSAATLQVGKSLKYSDAWWQGTLDEISIHTIARAFNPYLRATYFRLTLYTLFYRLTVFNNVKSIGSAEMGGGTRWWVYERDQSLYAIRENTLGLFSPEVQLTQIGLQVNGTMGPGGASNPELIYDKTTDTLYVAFISSGKVFKLTAGVGDSPSTQMMPYTADTAGIAKVATQYETSRIGTGGASLLESYPTFVNRVPIKQNAGDSGGMGTGVMGWVTTKTKLVADLGESIPAAPPTLAFTTTPAFGLLLADNNAYGVAFFSYIAGVETFLGVTTQHEQRLMNGPTLYYFPITNRVYGMQYYAKSLDRGGEYGVNASNTIQDLFGRADPYDSNYNVLVFNRNGEAPEVFVLGAGCPILLPDTLTFVNRTPIKLSAADYTGTMGCGGSSPLLTMSCSPSPTAPQRKPVEA